MPSPMDPTSDCPVCGAKESLRADVQRWATTFMTAAPEGSEAAPCSVRFYLDADEDQYIEEIGLVFCTQCMREWSPREFGDLVLAKVREAISKEVSA